MRPKMFVFLAAGFGLLAMVMPMLAHHSFMVGFDMSKAIVMKGVVTKVTWTNPHIAFYIDVTGEHGKVRNWGIDAASPTALVRSGWTRNSLRVGDSVAVEAFPARNGQPFAAATWVTLPKGRRLFAGSDGAYSK